MSLPISVPYTFASATTDIPLSQLDADFTTVVNGVNGIGNGANQLANVSITGGTITGITPLGAAAGGTGLATITANNVILGNGTGIVQVVAPGTTGNVLTSDGTTWKSQASGSGGLTAGTPLVLNPYATSTTTTQAHGLGARPKFFDIELECLSADLNYTAGDIVKYAVSAEANPGNNNAYALLADATNLTLLTSTNALNLLNKTTYANGTIAVSNWKLTITPYKF